MARELMGWIRHENKGRKVRLEGGKTTYQEENRVGCGEWRRGGGLEGLFQVAKQKRKQCLLTGKKIVQSNDSKRGLGIGPSRKSFRVVI